MITMYPQEPGSKLTCFMSRADAEQLSRQRASSVGASFKSPIFDPRAVLISINSPKNDRNMFGEVDPGYVWSKPDVSVGWTDVLSLEFNDVDPTHCSAEWRAKYRLFDDGLADQVLDFLEKHKDAPFIGVHCEAGISRSAGTAKFISVMFNLSFDNGYMLYNKHVFTTLIRRWNQRLYGAQEYGIDD